MSNRKNRLVNSERFNNSGFLSRADKAMTELDPDLYEFFDDMRLGKSKTKKASKKKGKFSEGDMVTVKDTFGTIIYGPYKSDAGKDTYEIDTEDQGIITVEDDGRKIKLYVHPVEESKDEDLL